MEARVYLIRAEAELSQIKLAAKAIGRAIGIETPILDTRNFREPTVFRRDTDAVLIAPKGFKPTLLEEYPSKGGYIAYKN